MQVRHVGIVCKNLEESQKFYCDFLGCKISCQMNESGPFIDKILSCKNINVNTLKLNLPQGEAQIELLSFKDPSSTGDALNLFSNGLTHFALRVENLDHLYSMMSQEKVDFLSPPCLSNNGQAKVCFCRDPNGVYIELVEIIEK